MGRPSRLLGVLVHCRLVVVFFLCACLLVMVATDTVNLGVAKATSHAAGGVVGRSIDVAIGSPAQYSGGRPAGADVFSSSKRRIPKGPDPIHNRRAGKTGITPRRD